MQDARRRRYTASAATTRAGILGQVRQWRQTQTSDM